MLTEERYAAILRILAEKKAVTVQELTRILDASESTVRRDLVALHKSGRLYKVYGGATSIDNNYSSSEEDMKTKRELHTEGKIAIARRAASLVRKNDFVYLDAGTTTLHMIDFLQEPTAVFVTNGMPHAAKLAAKGFMTYSHENMIFVSPPLIITPEQLDEEFVKLDEVLSEVDKMI